MTIAKARVQLAGLEKALSMLGYSVSLRRIELMTLARAAAAPGN
jgi:hypothetical protein